MKIRNVVEAIIVNEKNEILLHKKTKDYKYGSGVWTFFGGEVENNETLEEALRREIKEEINYDIKKFKFFKDSKYKLPHLKVKGTRYTYIVYFDGDISQISLSEGAGFGFFSKSEIKELKVQNLIAKDLNKYYQIDGDT